MTIRVAGLLVAFYVSLQYFGARLVVEGMYRLLPEHVLIVMLLLGGSLIFLGFPPIYSFGVDKLRWANFYETFTSIPFF